MADLIWQEKWKKFLDWDNIWHSGVFGVADYVSKLKIQKFKMANLIWKTKMQNLRDWDDIRYAGIIGVTDHESRLKIQ